MNKALMAAIAVGGMSGAASAQLYVSEAYIGLDGNDGTADWIELTWLGAGTFDTGTLFYDDDSMDPTVNANLTSFVLGTGESAVFLIGTNAGDIAVFNALWGGGINVGLTGGGGALGQGGDAVYLFDGNTAGANVIASRIIGGNGGAMLETWEYSSGGVESASAAGVNGAYASLPFFNDDIGVAPDFLVQLVGSPGAIPTPGALALLGLGAIGGVRRRR